MGRLEISVALQSGTKLWCLRCGNDYKVHRLATLRDGCAAELRLLIESDSAAEFGRPVLHVSLYVCLLYTSDAADD